MRILQTGPLSRRASCGFTLIELLIVLFILGIASFLLTPRLENIISGGDLRLASRIIIGEIHNARGIAAYTHLDQDLLLNMDENTIYPVEIVSADERFAGEASRGHNIPPAIRRMPEGVSLEEVFVLSRGRFQGGSAAIRFYANGCVEQSRIHLRNERGASYTLDINPLTGNTVLKEG